MILAPAFLMKMVGYIGGMKVPWGEWSQLIPDVVIVVQ
jgi:hypothetical protein